MMSYPKDIFSRMFGETGKTDHSLLYPKEEVDIQETDDALLTNIFSVMLSRRSQRKFENREVEDSKVEMILQLRIPHQLQVVFKDSRFIT